MFAVLLMQICQFLNCFFGRCGGIVKLTSEQLRLCQIMEEYSKVRFWWEEIDFLLQALAGIDLSFGTLSLR